MLQAGRSRNAGGYRFGFNGMEQTKGVQGNSQGTFYDYKNRDYDPWNIRFKRTDALESKYPFYSPYQFAGNKPINSIDLDGLEEFIRIHCYTITPITQKLKYVNTTYLNRKSHATPSTMHPDYKNQGQLLWSQYQNESKYGDVGILDIYLGHDFKTIGYEYNPPIIGDGNGEANGLGVGVALIGGFGLEVGRVTDGYGNSALYFSFDGRIGYGGGLGIGGQDLKPINGHNAVGLDDFAGIGFGIEGGVGPVTGSYGRNKLSTDTPIQQITLQGGNYESTGGSMDPNISSVFTPKKWSLGANWKASITWLFGRMNNVHPPEKVGNTDPENQKK